MLFANVFLVTYRVTFTFNWDYNFIGKNQIVTTFLMNIALIAINVAINVKVAQLAFFTLLTPCKRESGNDKCDYEYVPHNIDFRI